MTALTNQETEELYRSLDPADEGPEDICDRAFLDGLLEAINADGGEPHVDWKKAARAPEGSAIPGNGMKLKEIRGAGTVYDWRDSPWTPANGGRIHLRGFTHHIPVIRNVKGIADFVTLRNVLVDQRLMVQSSTDSEGNIALFTPFDILCYHNKGGNQLFTGCEHMHFGTEDWSKRQLRAMAWVIQLSSRKHDIPDTRWKLAAGSGVVRVLEEGQGWHSEVAHYAGFNDRSDPWGNTPHQKVVERWQYVRHCLEFFEEHGHFEGA